MGSKGWWRRCHTSPYSNAAFFRLPIVIAQVQHVFKMDVGLCHENRETLLRVGGLDVGPLAGSAVHRWRQQGRQGWRGGSAAGAITA